jgi:ribulose-phosphate 3-epimerase
MALIISPSILSSDFRDLAGQIHQAEEAGADWIHVDVMDGHFVPNITMGPFIVETCRRITALPLDVHLMIEQPERYLQAFADAGATNLTVHVETCPNLYRTLETIRELGCRPGVTLNPGTPALSLKEAIPLADLVLVMTVSPGYSGQVYIPQMTGKIREVRHMLDESGSKAWLEVDGGLTVETLPEAVQSGATAIVAATAVFKHPGGIRDGIQALRDANPKK